jgi:hypothetical protein
MTYGVTCNVPYDETNEEHVGRKGKVHKNLMGEERIADAFDVILNKASQFLEECS